jgi:hypothetical protein
MEVIAFFALNSACERPLFTLSIDLPLAGREQLTPTPPGNETFRN